MSDETTQNLLGAQMGELITLVRNLTDKHSATDARVERLERVLEERLYDTRPIWEAVRAQVQELGERIAGIESEMTGMRSEMTGMRSEVAGMRTEMVDTRSEMTGVRTEMADTRSEMTGIRTEMADTRSEMTGMRSEMADTRSEMTEMRKQNTQMLVHMVTILTQMNEMRVETANGFRGVNRRVALLGKTLIDMTVDIHELQDKVEKIESQPT